MRAHMAVLHVVFPAGVGGLERVVEALATGQRRRGHRVAVAGIVVPAHAEPTLLTALRDAGVEVHVVLAAGRRYLRERAAIGELCRTLQPDVVHTHGYRPDVVDAPAARRLGVPTVTTAHGFTGGDWKNRLYERFQLRAFRRFDAVVAVSRPLADRLARERVPREHLHLVQNAWAGKTDFESGPEARQALGAPAEGRLIGWVGRFTREKGADVLVQALALLDGPPATAVMVGDGPELGALRAEAARLGVGGRIIWPGAVPDAGRLMRAFDVFVLSSRTEGTPIVLFEAMAAGVPVVVAAVGGVPDVVGDGEAALVPPDDPRALAAALRRVLADPASAGARTAAAGRRLATQFAVDPWLDRYEQVYESLLNRPGRRRQPSAGS
jgi:glycosyltransferase involved in cell wall biosynthesis